MSHLEEKKKVEEITEDLGNRIDSLAEKHDITAATMVGILEFLKNTIMAVEGAPEEMTSKQAAYCRSWGGERGEP